MHNSDDLHRLAWLHTVDNQVHSDRKRSDRLRDLGAEAAHRWIGGQLAKGLCYPAEVLDSSAAPPALLSESADVTEIGGSLRFCGELLRMAWLKLRFI